MRLDEITNMNQVSEFVSKFFHQHMPGSLHGAPAMIVFGELANTIDMFKTQVNRFLAKNDYPLYLDDISVKADKGLNGAAFYPTTHDANGNKSPNGRIEIKIPAVPGDTYERDRKYILRYLINSLSHEIGHGLQVSQTNGYAAYKSAEKQLLSGPEETKYFNYLTSHLETEMQAFSAAHDLFDLARDHKLTVDQLLSMAISDKQNFLKLINVPGLLSLHSMFVAYDKFPASPAKTKGLKRFLKKLYQYVQAGQKKDAA